MNQWRYVQAYSTGTSHYANNLPCQDRTVSKTIVDGSGQEIFLAAVADGAGSAYRSEYGAEIATKLILSKIEDYFRQGEVLANLSREIVGNWIEQISDQICELANDEGLGLREYACTLLAAVVKPTDGVFFQIGDGAIVIGTDEDYFPVFWPVTGEYVNSTYFITDKISLKELQFKSINNQLIEDIALMSDGLQGLALQFATKTAHSPFFKPMFARLAEESNPGLSEVLNASLKNFLDSERVCNRTDDDKSLILSTCRCNLLSQPKSKEELNSNEAL
uniref:Serine/threonine phosphoprotein phosphatase n=1 Tax=Cyanothece sp. (strain PCC 7425 / ATCC 29141) TaxID=395961 RepID=B8HUC5_CYAP4